MVGRLIQNHHICAAHHHLAKHTSYLFTTGKHAGLLQRFLTTEQHSAQPTANIGIVLLAFLCKGTQPFNQAVLVALKIFCVILRKICSFCGNSPFKAALIRLQFAHQNLEQRSSCDFILADKGNLFVRANHKANIIQHLLAVNGFGNPIHQKHIVADLSVLLKATEGISAAGRLNGIHLQVIQQLLSGGCLLCLGGIRTKALDEVLQLLNLLFHALILILQLTLCHLGIAVPEIIVADKHGNLAIIDIRNICADLIQEMTVMGNHDNRIFKVHQEILQPFDRMNIQMVGRLVQKQNIGIAEQCLCQKHLHLLSACQLLHLRIMEFIRNPQTVQQHFRIGFRSPAVQLRKFTLQLCRLNAVLVCEVLLHIKCVLLLADIIQSFMPI